VRIRVAIVYNIVEPCHPASHVKDQKLPKVIEGLAVLRTLHVKTKTSRRSIWFFIGILSSRRSTFFGPRQGFSYETTRLLLILGPPLYFIVSVLGFLWVPRQSSHLYYSSPFSPGQVCFSNVPFSVVLSYRAFVPLSPLHFALSPSQSVHLIHFVVYLVG
jgi:hypothetical protein